MKTSTTIYVLVFLAAVYFIVSAGALAFLYIYYHGRVTNLQEKVSTHSLPGTRGYQVPTDKSAANAPWNAQSDAQWGGSSGKGGCICEQTPRETKGMFSDNQQWTSQMDADSIQSEGSEYADIYQWGMAGSAVEEEASVLLYCSPNNDTQLKMKVDTWIKWLLDEYKDNTGPGFDDVIPTITTSVHPTTGLAFGKIPTTFDQYDLFHTITSWRMKHRNSQSRRTYLRGLVDFHRDRGSFQVDRKGYYQVYSKVTLQVQVESVDQMDAPAMYHITVVGNPDERPEPQNLMKSGFQMTSDDIDSSSAHHTSFHSGVFHLFSGDEVFVKLKIPLDTPNEVTFVPAFSYFGIYLLSHS